MKSQQFFITVFLVIQLLIGSLEPVSAKEQHSASSTAECVILLHGLARTSSSMETMADALAKAGYKVVNIDYPSREFSIEKLSQQVIPVALSKCHHNSQSRIHFVTHSLGGILVRSYLSENDITDLGRVVMLSPPNQGSEVVDKLKSFPGFFWLNGPAGQQLGTDPNSIPLNLGDVSFDLGIITGNRSINPILSMLIPGDDDGKVSIKRAQVPGMTDFIVLPHTHTFIMDSKTVINQTIQFLKNGRFEK